MCVCGGGGGGRVEGKVGTRAAASIQVLGFS